MYIIKAKNAVEPNFCTYHSLASTLGGLNLTVLEALFQKISSSNISAKLLAGKKVIPLDKIGCISSGKT
jgi:hypothetical protein